MTRPTLIVRTLLLWIWVWPIVTGVLLCFRHAHVALPIPIQTLILSALLVPLISLVLAPAMHRLAISLLERTPFKEGQ